MKILLNWLKSWVNKPQAYLQFRRFSIFKDLNTFELFQLNNLMHHREYQANTTIYEAGYPLEVILFIEKGEIEISGGIHGKSTIVLGKNQYLGLIDMFHETIRSSTAVAKTAVTAFALSRTDLMDIIHANPKTGVKILMAVCSDFSNQMFLNSQAGNIEG